VWWEYQFNSTNR